MRGEGGPVVGSRYTVSTIRTVPTLCGPTRVLVVTLIRIGLGKVRGGVAGVGLVSCILILLVLLIAGGVVLFGGNIVGGVGSARGVVVIACIDQVLVCSTVVRHRRGVGIHGLVSEGCHARSGGVVWFASIDGAFCIVEGIPRAIAV